MSHWEDNGVRQFTIHIRNTLPEVKFRYITDKRRVSLTPKGKTPQLEITGCCGSVRVYATAVCTDAVGLKSHPHELYGDRWDRVQDGVLSRTLELGQQQVLYDLPALFFHKTKQNEARGKLEARARALQTFGIQDFIHADSSTNDYKYEEFRLVLVLCWDNGSSVHVASQPICDISKDEWQIDRLSAVSGSAAGGTEITLTTSKFLKLKGYDVVFESLDGSWKASGTFGQALYRVSLLVTAPRYRDLKIKAPVDVNIYLERDVEVTDAAGVKQKRRERTEAKTWTYTPVLARPPEEGNRVRKRKKVDTAILDESANYEPESHPGLPWTAGAGFEAPRFAPWHNLAPVHPMPCQEIPQTVQPTSLPAGLPHATHAGSATHFNPANSGNNLGFSGNFPGSGDVVTSAGQATCAAVNTGQAGSASLTTNNTGNIALQPSGAPGESQQWTINGVVYLLEPTGVATTDGCGQLTLPSGETYRLVPAGSPPGVDSGPQGPPRVDCGIPLDQEMEEEQQPGLPPGPDEPEKFLSLPNGEDILTAFLAFNSLAPAGPDDPSASAGNGETDSFLAQHDGTFGTAYRDAAPGGGGSAAPVVTSGGDDPGVTAGPSGPAGQQGETSGQVVYRRSLSSTSGQDPPPPPARDHSPPDSGFYSMEQKQDHELTMEELLKDLGNPPSIEDHLYTMLQDGNPLPLDMLERHVDLPVQPGAGR